MMDPLLSRVSIAVTRPYTRLSYDLTPGRAVKSRGKVKKLKLAVYNLMSTLNECSTDFHINSPDQ